jgi:hypothetical protein
VAHCRVLVTEFLLVLASAAFRYLVFDHVAYLAVRCV